MNYTALSLQQTPPISVPLRFMLSAPLFAILAAVLMLYTGPELFMSRWQPALLAITHLLTLGFLAMVMFGAMFQLLPVLMGSLLPRPVLLSSIIHGLLSLGIVLMAWGWIGVLPVLFNWASLVLGTSFAIFIGLMGFYLLRSLSTHITRYMMLMALLALLGTITLGLLMLLGLGGWTTTPVHHWIDLHLSWGLAGWVLLLVMGVSYQVIPMFQITSEYPQWHKRWIGISIFTLVLLLGLVPSITGQLLPLLLAALVLIYALTTMRLLKARRRKLPDVTLRFWWLAMISLLVLSVLMISPLPPSAYITMTILFIIGFAMSAANGMLYKIIPFLIWLHLNTRLQANGRWQGSVPNMRQVIAEHHGYRQFLLHLLSLLLLLLSSAGFTYLYYSAALGFLLSQLYLFWNIINAIRLYQRISGQNSE
ncbi:MAG: hypothetical protein OEX12_10345 [Gammaproteobacteria bacterium]|nr:hypothetical protein [Gammaproteobacteria bacterium]